MPISPALGQVARGSPKKIVFQLVRAGMLEAVHLAALRIDARHDVPNRAVLPGRIHGLKNQQDRIAVRGVEQFLLGTESLDVLVQEILVFLVSPVHGIDTRRPLSQMHLCVFPHSKIP